jgi:hypothetical protein
MTSRLFLDCELRPAEYENWIQLPISLLGNSMPGPWHSGIVALAIPPKDSIK